MAAPKGNQFRVALKDPKVRQAAFQDFCDHLAAGKMIRSWFYEKDGYHCCYETMVNYIKNNPNEFDAVKKRVAESKGHKYWEKIAEDSAKGTNKNVNTASLQMIMRNKFGWDREEHKFSGSNITIKVDPNGIATGFSAKAVSEEDTSGAE